MTGRLVEHEFFFRSFRRYAKSMRIEQFLRQQRMSQADANILLCTLRL